MKLCQIISWKSDCESEVLPDCFVRTRLWKWSSVSLIYEYCTSVVSSGKLFRTKMCLWLNRISGNLLCQFKSSQLVYSLQPLKVLPSSAYHLERPYKRWAMFNLCRSGRTTLGLESHESSQHACTPWCAPVPVRHVYCISLQSAWVELSFLSWFFFESPPSWLNLLSNGNSNIRNSE